MNQMSSPMFSTLLKSSNSRGVVLLPTAWSRLASRL